MGKTVIGWIFLFVLIIDQISKLWAHWRGWPVINQGISFSWLNGHISWPMILILILVIGLILRKFFPLYRISVELILAGAISNLLDRIIWGGVVDWLPVPFLSLKNNLADWAIYSGIVMISVKEICKFPSFMKIKTWQ